MNQLLLFRKGMTPIRKLLLMHLASGGSLIEESATGNPLTFVTDVVKPFLKFELSMLPVQSGSGDPSPENVRPITGWTGATAYRTGSNLIDDSKRYLNATGKTLVIGNTSSEFNIPLSPGTYTFSCEFDNVYYNANIRGSTDSITVPIWTAESQVSSATFTITKYDLYRITLTDSTSVDTEKIGHCWLNYGETASTYEAYNGTSVSVTFPALGKNLFDEVYTDIDGTVRYKNIYVGEGTFTFSTTMPPRSETVTNLFAVPGDTGTGTSAENGFSNGNPRTITSINGWVRIGYRNFSVDPEQYHTMIEKGSSATAYEPYTNTVLEGNLNLTTGVLTANRMMLTLTGADSWSATGGSKFYVSIDTLVQGNYAKSTDTGAQYCNMYPFGGISSNGSAGVTSDKHFYLQRYPHADHPEWNRLWVYDTGFTLEEFKEAINTTPLVVTYPIVEQTYQLTPQQIQTLIGTNTVWSNANGDCDVTYLKKG